MSEVASSSGIVQVPGMGFSNAYLVEIEQHNLVLIDTGTPGKAQRVISLLASMGREPGDISYITLTHADADHSGSAAELKRLTGAKIAIGDLDAARLSGDKKLKEVGGLGGVMTGLFGFAMRVERIRADLELKDGDLVGPLKIVSTPGHTDGSISVYKPGEAIFVGDLLRTDNSGKIMLASARMSRDMAEVKRSVERISKLEFSMLLPGHGKPIQQDASVKLKGFVSNGFR